jgi:flagellar protein FlaG
MSNEATALSPVVAAVPSASISAGPRDQNARQPAERAPDYRLVIEEGPRRGTFVYKTVDRTTGETIRQFPREELVRMHEDPDYVAGIVADTTA